MTTLTPLPSAPQRADPTTFATRADVWVNALETVFTPQMNLIIPEINALSSAATTGASTATTKASEASASASTASTAASTATTKAAEALVSANSAETSRIQASKLNLGNKSTPPTVDNQGDTLLAGATYYDTTLSKWRVWNGTAWADGISSVAGVSSVNGLTGDVSFNSTSLSGTTTIYITQVIAYTITDFDAFSTYSVSVSAGSVTRAGADISFTAPATAGSVTLTVTTNGVTRAITLTVLPSTVATPTITSPASDATDVKETPTITSSAFATIGQSDTHLSTDWEVRKSSDNSLVWSSYNDTTNKVSIVVPSGVLAVSTSYIFKARHNGNTLGSSAYASVTASTVASFFNLAGDIDGLVQLSSIQAVWSAGATYTAGNIVIIRYGDTRFVEYKSLTSSNTNNNPVSSPTHWELVYDNNLTTSGYFGEVIGSTCVTDKGEWLAATAYSIGDMVVVKNIPVPKKQSDLTAYVSKTSNTNKSPASNPTDWEQRNALPTGTALANSLGLSATGAVLQNNDTGWLKFVHQGKVKYIAKKSFMHTVSWNDIAKAEAVYGNRTIRIGSNLFRVSILSGAAADPSSWVTTSTATDNKGADSEWNQLVYRVCSVIPTDGATTYHGGKQIGSNWKDFSEADLNITGDGGYVWCKETPSYNLSGRVFRGYSSLSYFAYIPSSYADTNVGWRPCLTLISEPEADSGLYNAEASGVGPSVASLQYDPITDTGFYGETTTTDLYTGTQISAATAVTAGTLQFDTDPWLKFYWHGQVLYIAKKPYRHTVSWDNINTANAVYGVNLGSTGRTRLTKGSIQLDVKLLKGATKDPSPASSPGRQWDELIYRVAAEVPAGQVGANWGTYTSADLQITGNGSYCWMQEIYQPDTSLRVGRGYSSLSDFSYNPSSTANALGGWRPCLALVR